MYRSKFSREINHKRRAGFGCILVPTREQQQAEVEIYQSLNDPASVNIPHKVFLWSCASGLKLMVDESTSKAVNEDEPLQDTYDMLTDMPNFMHAEEAEVLILCDIGPFLEQPQIRRLLLERIHWCRYQRHFIVLLQKGESLPSDLIDEISTVKHHLPTREASRDIVNTFLVDQGFPAICDKGLDNLQGLTATGQSNAIGLSIIDAKENTRDNIDIGLLRRHKENEIGKRPYLKIVEPSRGFDAMIGHELFKEWCATMTSGFSIEAIEDGLPPPKGCLLVGPPGTGKTRMFEALAHEWGYPLVVFDVGLALGGILGESEHNVADALEIADSMSPCILMVDEVERAFGTKKGVNDGGTSDLITGKMLNWLSVKETPVFVGFTANEVTNLPAALIRSGRLDERFCMDLPNAEERLPIWEYFLSKKRHKISAASFNELTERSELFVGAEIEAVSVSAHRRAFNDGKREIIVDDLFKEIDSTTPLAISLSEQVNKMREWAVKNARPTSARKDNTTQKKGRKLV